MSVFQEPLDNFLRKFGDSTLMLLTLRTQKEFLIGFLGVFLLHLHLEFFR